MKNKITFNKSRFSRTQRERIAAVFSDIDADIAEKKGRLPEVRIIRPRKPVCCSYDITPETDEPWNVFSYEGGRSEVDYDPLGIFIHHEIKLINRTRYCIQIHKRKDLVQHPNGNYYFPDEREALELKEGVGEKDDREGT